MSERDEDRLPDALISDLSAMYRAEVRVGPEMDQAITNAARAHLARRGRLRPLLRWAGAAAAAVVILAVILTPRPARHQVAAINGDVNGDGVVDIRDALVLARKLEAGQTPRQDVNHDGVTDRRDVDAIATMSVKLNGEAVR